MIQQARAAKVADVHALVAMIERSQIFLPKSVSRMPIPYEDEVDIAILAWIASHARGVLEFGAAQGGYSDVGLSRALH